MSVVWGEYLPGRVRNHDPQRGKNKNGTRPVVLQIRGQRKGESGIDEVFGQLGMTTWYGTICNHLTNYNLSRHRVSARLRSQ